MSRPKVVAGGFLNSTARWMRQREASLAKISGDLVELDIKACRQQALFGAEWAKRRDKIQSELSAMGMSEAEWTKNAAGSDISQMRRRVRLYRKWDQYEVARREAGDVGVSGLYYALSLVLDRITIATDRGASPVRSGPALMATTAGLDLSRCTFLTGDSLVEVKKLPSKSVNVIVTSPPYFPMKRDYGVTACVGREPTLQKYIGRLVGIFREARRVLKDNGTLWIVVDDSYSRRGGTWKPETLNARRPNQQKSYSAARDGLSGHVG